jgi:hypothetical protein
MAHAQSMATGIASTYTSSAPVPLSFSAMASSGVTTLFGSPL